MKTNLILTTNKQYHISIDDMFYGVVVRSKEGSIKQVNTMFCDICGRTKEWLLGKEFSDFLFIGDSLFKTPLQFELLLKGELVVNERNIIHKNGKVLPIEMKTKMQLDGTFISFITDISSRKIKEESIQSKVDKLSEFNKNKDIFIASLAHDLKGPFQSVLGFLDLLSTNIQSYPIETITQYIEVIKKVSINNFNLLEDTLNWARISSNKFNFNPETICLSEICNGIIDHFKFMVFQKNIAISHVVSNDLTIVGDEHMIKVVLRNLISNAIKFTNNGGEIKIDAIQKIDCIEITVSDNGIGIAPNQIDQLFDISNKLSTHGTENEIGTGLGLILCKELIEKHNGKIWVESELDCGSNFKFSIPNKTALS